MTKAFKFFFVTLVIIACQPNDQLSDDGDQIMALIEKQLSFGARLNNSTAKEKCTQWIKQTAQKLGYKVRIDRWTESVDGEKREFANIIATKKGIDEAKFIIAGSHYDTKKIQNYPKFIGANDGASSTAVLIAIMNKLVHFKNKKTIHFTFFDGEECFGKNNNYRRPHQGSLNGLHGSTRYAKQILYSNKVKNCDAMLLMDMVGDKDLNISFPTNNSKSLINKALNIARKEQVSEFFSSSNQAILDDHLPFQEIGIPTINFIDFNYGKNNQYWHTDQDTLDKLNPKSLAITARIFTKLLKELAK